MNESAFVHIFNFGNTEVCTARTLFAALVPKTATWATECSTHRYQGWGIGMGLGAPQHTLLHNLVACRWRVSPPVAELTNQAISAMGGAMDNAGMLACYCTDTPHESMS